jgi:tRNA U55 pseudouridine synthase TruB
MPKVSPSSLPVSALFGVIKPSGPTSMSIINDIQRLVSRSMLFADAEKNKGTKADHGRRGKRARDAIKIGQGGTLDPLADGVLGALDSNTLKFFSRNSLIEHQWLVLEKAQRNSVIFYTVPRYLKMDYNS